VHDQDVVGGAELHEALEEPVRNDRAGRVVGVVDEQQTGPLAGRGVDRVEVFSLSKGYNMTGWRCAAIVGNAQAIASYWRLKTNVDSGMFEAVQLAGAAALSPQLDPYKAEMNEIYARRRDLVCDALAAIGVDVTPPRGTIYIWAPVPEGFDSAAAYCEHVLEEAAVVLSPGGAYGRNGEGFFRISLTTPDDRLTEAVERLGRLAR